LANDVKFKYLWVNMGELHQTLTAALCKHLSKNVPILSNGGLQVSMFT